MDSDAHKEEGVLRKVRLTMPVGSVFYHLTKEGSAKMRTGSQQIPIVDLRAQHDELRPEIDAAIKEVIDNSSFIGGPLVEGFEREFASFCGVEFAVGCASGTDALRLGLMALDIKPGEAVITVPHTFIATVEAITMVGAQPVFVDIDGDTYNLSPTALAAYVQNGCRQDGDGSLIDKATGRRIAAILPVHLYGLPTDMALLWRLAERHQIKIVEDACQAHGAVYCSDSGEERKAGTLGDVAAFSFYPGKNLGAMGEAGAVVTGDPAMAWRMRSWRDHGQTRRYVHDLADGWNGRLDAIQAAVLSIKLRKLAEWNKRRRQAAGWYRDLLGGDERIVLPAEPAYGYHVYHLFVIRVPDRDRIRGELAAHGISTGLHYPVPLHRQEAYRHLGLSVGAFPESEAAARDILSLPMYPHLTQSQVEFVCDSLCKSLDR